MYKYVGLWTSHLICLTHGSENIATYNLTLVITHPFNVFKENPDSDYYSAVNSINFTRSEYYYYYAPVTGGIQTPPATHKVSHGVPDV